MKLYVKQHHSPKDRIKKERLEIIIIIIKLLQLCVGVWERGKNERKEREQMIEHDK